MERVFEGLKVVELAAVLAGPAVGLFFAELGATVVKIENKKTGGDVTRSWRLPSEKAEAPVSAYYCAINWNKQVLLLDLREEKDRQQVYDLVKTADVVLANFKAGGAAALKMDYSTLKQYNEQLIYGSINGFGATSERVAFDVVLQAESGFMYMNGAPNGPPTKMPVALIDILAAHQLKQGVLVALLQRYKTGKGGHISVSLLEAAVAALANQATNWLMAGHVPQRMGSLHPNIAPYGELFTSQDGQQLVLAIGSNRQFQHLCACLACPELAANPLYQSNVLRVEHRARLALALEAAFAAQEATPLLARCHAQQVPIGLVRDMKAVFEQPALRGMILDEEIEGQATKRVRTAVFKKII
ncbi:MAG: CaiB/BaiF CoA transferase family protein [Aureispira sp.]